MVNLKKKLALLILIPTGSIYAQTHDTFSPYIDVTQNAYFEYTGKSQAQIDEQYKLWTKQFDDAYEHGIKQVRLGFVSGDCKNDKFAGDVQSTYVKNNFLKYFNQSKLKYELSAGGEYSEIPYCANANDLLGLIKRYDSNNSTGFDFDIEVNIDANMKNIKTVIDELSELQSSGKYTKQITFTFPVDANAPGITEAEFASGTRDSDLINSYKLNGDLSKIAGLNNWQGACGVSEISPCYSGTLGIVRYAFIKKLKFKVNLMTMNFNKSTCAKVSTGLCDMPKSITQAALNTAMQLYVVAQNTGYQLTKKEAQAMIEVTPRIDGAVARSDFDFSKSWCRDLPLANEGALVHPSDVTSMISDLNQAGFSNMTVSMWSFGLDTTRLSDCGMPSFPYQYTYKFLNYPQ